MPWILQMAGFALLLMGVAIALWVSVWVLLFLFAVGILAVIWSHLRTFLAEKGILSPRFRAAPAPEGEATIVEGSFTRVEATLPTQNTPQDEPHN